MFRIVFCFFVLLIGVSRPLFAEQKAEPITVTDLVGRTVTLQQPAQRFVISEGRYVLTLGLLRPENPVKGLVGMMQPISWAYPDLERQVFEAHPEAKNIALFGKQDASSVSVEKIIDLKPELAIFGIQDHGPGSKNAELLMQLENAGIKVVFIDFRMQPLTNTVPSLKLMGKVLAAEDRVQAYLDFYQEKYNQITAAVKNVSNKPSVFLQAHAGRFPCCVAMADGMLGPFVELAGGTNIADAVAPGPVSRHTMEFLLDKNPDVWIGTASGTRADFDAKKNMLSLGPGLNQNEARASLAAFLEPKEYQAMSAVAEGRAYGIWHDFYNSPLNIVALEAFAKWIHPERFPDADPEATVATLFSTYLPYEWRGTATVSLGK